MDLAFITQLTNDIWFIMYIGARNWRSINNKMFEYNFAKEYTSQEFHSFNLIDCNVHLEIRMQNLIRTQESREVI